MSESEYESDQEMIIEESDDEKEMITEEDVDSDEEDEMVVEDNPIEGKMVIEKETESDDNDMVIEKETESDDNDMVIEKETESDEEIIIEETDDEQEIEEFSSSTFSEELKKETDIILKSEQGKIFELAIKSETPQKFIYKINEELVSVKEKIKNNKDIIENYQFFFDRNIKIFPREFLMLFYVANKTRSKKNLVENFNMFSTLIGNQIFFIEAFEDYKNKFDREFQIYMDKTKEDYIKFKKFYKKIEELPPSQEIDSIIDTVREFTTTVEIKIQDEDYLFDKTNALSIFNNMRCNSEFNFIRLNLKENEYYKFYDEGDKNYDNYILQNNLLESEDNTIYIFYNLEMYKNYYRGILKINLETSILTIEYSGQEINIFKEKFSNFYPTVKFLEIEEKSMTGDFEILFPNFDETKLYYLTLFDSIISEFLFIREVSSPRSLKENIKYYYVGTDEIRKFIDYSIYFNINKLQGDKYNISFHSKKHSPKLIKEFIYVINKLITRFNQQTNDKIPFYSMTVTPYTGIDGSGLGGKEDNKISTDTQRYKKKIDALYLKNKNLFSKNFYARSCTCQKQPIIVPPEDVKDWENYTYDGKKRNVVLFPPKDSTQKVSKDYYVCPDDEYPILTLRQNPDNSSDYPLVPCCNISNFPEDLYRDYDTIRNKPNIYWAEREEYKGKGKGILKTNKILSTKRLGYLPDEIENILREVENNKFIREGVLKNFPSSFILIFFKIVKDLKPLLNEDDINPKYLYFFNNLIIDRMFQKIETAQSQIEITRLINKFLIFLADGKFYQYINFREVIQQETYSYSKEEMISIFKDTKIEKDSKLFYKLMEKIFMVNIFVFVYDKDIESSYLETPNHDSYHIREIREDLPCVLIFKHLRKDKFSVYEIIRTEEIMKETNSYYIFPPKYNKYFKHKYYKNSYYIIEDSKSYGPITVRKNPYSNINWGSILKDYKVISQKINTSGRTYSFNLEYKEGKFMTLFCQPTFPFDCPQDEEIYSCPKKDIIKLFGKDFVTGSEGLWYSINDLTEGFFIYSKEIPVNDLICKNYVIFKNRENRLNIYENIRICKKNAIIIKQTILWLYLLEKNKGMDLESWKDKYLILEKDLEKEIFSSNYIKIPTRFPKNIETAKDGIKYLHDYVPRVFDKNNIYLYPELYHHITEYIINFDKTYTGLDEIKIEAISDYFKSIEDFEYHPFNKIIIGRESFNLWKDKNSFFNTNRNTIHEIQDINKRETFIWNDTVTKKLFYVQNNEEQSFVYSFVNCLFWRIFKINFSYKYKTNKIWNNFVSLKLTEDILYKFFGWNFENLKLFIKENIDKDKFFKNYKDCLIFLYDSGIPYKINKEYSYIVYSKTNDKIKISNKYIIDNSNYLCLYKYSEGGFASLLPIN